MKHLQFLLRPVLFYLGLFVCYRLAFLLLFAREEPLGEMAYAFLAAFRLDLAVCSYIQFLPYILWMISFGRMQNFFTQVLRYYHVFVLAVIHLQGVANLVVYRYWDSLLNWRALSYLDNPKEAAASVSWLQLATWTFLLVLAIVVTSRFFLKKFFVAPAERRTWSRLVFGILAPGLLVLAARGGWQFLPINESVAYYSSVRQLNDAATNSLWHLGHSANVASSTENIFQSMEDPIAQGIVDSLMHQSPHPSHFPVLKDNRPNIVFLVLESFSSDLLGCLGGFPSAAPFLDSLASQGLLFTNIYASGFRTDQGLTSLLSGFPATPMFSVIRYPEKSAQLPSLVKELEKQGYGSSYYYGGAGNFRNMKAYCFNVGFDIFRDEEDFPSELPRSKWGVHDEFVLRRQAEEVSKAKQPFYSMVMTLSNHEPYEVPMPVHFAGDDDASMFRNSAYYTDRCLQNYFRGISAQPWYANTLFVIVADHGHALPMKRPMPEPSSHRLPIIFFGDVLKPEYRGHTVTVTGNHHDLPATVLRMLGRESKAFPWSRDLLDTSALSFAYYEQEDGFGWIEDSAWVYYSNLQGRTILKSEPAPSEQAMIRRGAAYLQKLYGDFLKY